MFKALLLDNSRQGRNRITADMSGTRRDATTHVSSHSIHW